MSTNDYYAKGFEDGLTSAITLARAGCSPDTLAAALRTDPGRTDPRGYCDLLAEIRRIADLDESGIGPMG